MNRQMGSISNKSARRVENCTRKVKTLLDIGADARFLQRPTHLLSNSHEPMTKDAEHNRVDLALARLLGRSTPVRKTRILQLLKTHLSLPSPWRSMITCVSRTRAVDVGVTTIVWVPSASMAGP